jgi:hypothetical protein
VLLSRCMRARSLRYTPRTPDPSLRPWELPYVIDDPAWARAKGYGPGRQQILAAKRGNANQRYIDALSAVDRAVYIAALYGPNPVGLSVRLPSGSTITRSSAGCQAAAETALYGDLATWFRVMTVVQNADAVVVPRVRGDARYRRAVAAWARCMRAAGRDVADPAEPRTGAVEPTRELAVAEATCLRARRGAV